MGDFAEVEAGVEAVGVPRAGVILGISKRSAEKLAGRGVLPTFRIGRRRLVRVADIQALIARLLAENARDRAAVAEVASIR